MTQPQTMAMVREKIRDELPTLLKLYRADKYLVNKIVASATAFFEEVRSDPGHPFRGEFDRMVLSFIDRLGSDRSYADRIETLKRDLLARPELSDLTRNIWSNARSFIERSASGETHVLQQHLAGMFVKAGEALKLIPNCARRSTTEWLLCSEVSSPIRKAECRASSPIKSRPGTWGSSFR